MIVEIGPNLKEPLAHITFGIVVCIVFVGPVFLLLRHGRDDL